MYARIILAGLVVSPLVWYLEWGGDRSAFVGEVILQLGAQGRAGLSALAHPLVLLPLGGLVLLLVAVWKRHPSDRWVLAGVLLLSTLGAMILVVAVLSRNIRIGLSLLPFILLVVAYFRIRKRWPRAQPGTTTEHHS